MTLREEIAKLLWQIYVRNEYGIEEYKDEYRYEYGVHNWTKYTEQDKKGYLEEADQILKLFEKVIYSIMQEEISKSHYPELKRKDNDLDTTDAIVRVCRKMKEELKK